MYSRPSHGVCSGETQHCQLYRDWRTHQMHCAWPRLPCVGIPVVVAHCTATRTPYSTDCSSTGGPSPLHGAMDLLVSSYVEKRNNTNDSASFTSPSIVGDQVGELCLLPAFQPHPSLLFGGHGAGALFLTHSILSSFMCVFPGCILVVVVPFPACDLLSCFRSRCPSAIGPCTLPSLPSSYSHANVRPRTLYR